MLKISFETGEMPSDIVERLDLWAIDDQDKLKEFVVQTLEDNPEVLKKYNKSPNVGLFQHLVGLVVKNTNKRGNIDKIKDILREYLDGQNLSNENNS